MKDLSQKDDFNRERYELLHQLDEFLSLPMAILGFVWLALLVADLVFGLTTALEIFFNTVWVIFILDFIIKLLIAPKKSSFLRANWLTAISLIVPAIRFFRFLSILRLARGLALTRIVASINRSMRALRFTMGRRGFGYIVALAIIVALANSSGMYPLRGASTRR